jgi:hypothetical protein
MKNLISKQISKQWSMLLVGILLAGTLAFLPTVAQAASEGWFPHYWGGDKVLPGFWVTGEVTEVEEGSVTVELPNRHHARGMMRHVSLQVTFAIENNSILLDEELAPLELSALEAGDGVVVAPRLSWGNVVASFLYAGDPEELAESTYRGKLVADNGDTLTLENGRDGELTVALTEETIWVDNGEMGRPTELPEDMALRLLGIAEENEDGDEVIRAVVITPAR